MVEVDGRLKPACCTPAWDGAVINTDTDEVRTLFCVVGVLQELPHNMFFCCLPAVCAKHHHLLT